MAPIRSLPKAIEAGHQELVQREEPSLDFGLTLA